jgi:hypothetical protein
MPTLILRVRHVGVFPIRDIDGVPRRHFGVRDVLHETRVAQLTALSGR